MFAYELHQIRQDELQRRAEAWRLARAAGAAGGPRRRTARRTGTRAAGRGGTGSDGTGSDGTAAPSGPAAARRGLPGLPRLRGLPGLLRRRPRAHGAV